MMTKNNSHKEIRVRIIDDHQMVRTGIRMLIESQPGMKVVGKAGNCYEALAEAASKKPNLILLDIDLGNENCLDFLPKLREAMPDARVLILTGVKDVKAHLVWPQFGCEHLHSARLSALTSPCRKSNFLLFEQEFSSTQFSVH